MRLDARRGKPLSWEENGVRVAWDAALASESEAAFHGKKRAEIDEATKITS